MKISRTSLPSKSAASGKATDVPATSGKTFADKLSGAKSEGTTAAADAKAAHARKGISVSDIGAELKAGTLTPEAAIDQVIQRIIDKQVGAQASPAVRSQLSAALKESLANDPLLAAKVRALGE